MPTTSLNRQEALNIYKEKRFNMPFAVTWDSKDELSRPLEVKERAMTLVAGTDNGNEIIHGDSIRVLDVLITQKRKFKCIYLDPEYGVGVQFDKDREETGEVSSGKAAVINFFPVVRKCWELLSLEGFLVIHIANNLESKIDLLVSEIANCEPLNKFSWQRSWRSKGDKIQGLDRDTEYILVWAKTKEARLNKVFLPYKQSTLESYQYIEKLKSEGRPYSKAAYKMRETPGKGKLLGQVWSPEIVPPLNNSSGEYVDGFTTQKPERLLSLLLYLTTKEGDSVLDPYAGSGTTGIVAEKMGRRWTMIEKEKETIEKFILPRLKAVSTSEPMTPCDDDGRLQQEFMRNRTSKIYGNSARDFGYFNLVEGEGKVIKVLHHGPEALYTQEYIDSHSLIGVVRNRGIDIITETDAIEVTLDPDIGESKDLIDYPEDAEKMGKRYRILGPRFSEKGKARAMKFHIPLEIWSKEE